MADTGLRAEKLGLWGKQTRRVRAMYTAAFAKEDRMPMPLMLLMAKLWHTRYLAFYDGDTLCGFIYMASLGHITFIMFFAVDGALRSRGYGGRILAAAQAMYPDNTMVVSIERCDMDVPDIENRRRRKRFYLKNGYADTGYLIKLGSQTQEVLVKNGAFDPRAFRFFFAKYSNFTLWPKIWRPGN